VIAGRAGSRRVIAVGVLDLLAMLELVLLSYRTSSAKDIELLVLRH